MSCCADTRFEAFEPKPSDAGHAPEFGYCVVKEHQIQEPLAQSTHAALKHLQPSPQQVSALLHSASSPPLVPLQPAVYSLVISQPPKYLHDQIRPFLTATIGTAQQCRRGMSVWLALCTYLAGSVHALLAGMKTCPHPCRARNTKRHCLWIEAWPKL